MEFHKQKKHKSWAVIRKCKWLLRKLKQNKSIIYTETVPDIIKYSSVSKRWTLSEFAKEYGTQVKLSVNDRYLVFINENNHKTFVKISRHLKNVTASDIKKRTEPILHQYV